MASEEDVQGMDAMSAAQYREQADPQEKLDAEETRRLLNEMIGDLPEMQKVCIPVSYKHLLVMTPSFTALPALPFRSM